jgi:ribosomal protein S6--L-glutamate ligase
MVGGSPLIVKLLEGTRKGVVLAETKKAAESVINLQSVNANILVQEFIKGEW